MISTVLVEHPWATTAALVLLLVVGPVVGRSLVARPHAAWVLAGVSLLPVVALTVVPTAREVVGGCAVQWALPTLGAVEVMANVVLFVPLVLLAAVASRRPVRAALVGSALSVGIEAVQAVAPVLGRSCDTTDWLANTLGAVLGGVLAWVALRLAPTGRPAGADRSVSR
ncbi:VanZ family protein [Cellulomonas sp. ATA003]|uniref:VanZ family protein n=1 Tax=Cellulomonas sp. ATA003 TaxID=3073064 RepID=UPI00287302AC|nr:VanZ family protein [Cellulomonas sp. ATA003]WNB86705.1 VanZ family protein [Cellulomonas sp. ATA003]